MFLSIPLFVAIVSAFFSAYFCISLKETALLSVLLLDGKSKPVISISVFLKIALAGSLLGCGDKGVTAQLFGSNAFGIPSLS